MLHRYILHNGAIREATDPLLAAGQVGVLSGWGVFTTLKVSEGVLFAFERHWARIARDAAAFHIPVPSDPQEIRRGLLKLVEANRAQDSTLRLAILRNTGSMWCAPGIGRDIDVVALTADTKDWGRGVKLTCQEHARHAASHFAGSKILSWAMNLTWLETAQRKGFDEVILLNERGEVAECTSANIFAAVGNEIWTPPLSSGCLPGITRELLLDEVHVNGFPLIEKTLFPVDLEAADEVFITSTTRDLLKVAEIDGRPAGSADRCRTTLSEAFSNYVDRYIARHRDLQDQVPA